MVFRQKIGPKTMGYLSTPSERPMLELRNACFNFEIGLSLLKLCSLKGPEKGGS